MIPDSELERVLVVTAHPDDVDFGASGTLAGWAAQGVQITYCIITDGDVRRAFETHDDIRELCATDVMTRQPLTIGPGALLNEALLVMEDRPSQISVLPVVDEAGKCHGLLRLHDIYKPSVIED